MGSFARLCLPIIAAAVCVTASSYTSSSVSCDDGEDYIPDSEDCTRFWRCANGKPYSFTCPAGLRFNVDISVCDWPDNVRCGATYTEDGSEEDSDDDEEHDEDNSDEEEETTYPYQPGPKYYDRKYYTENPNYFKPTAAPVYRPIPTRRPVYKPVYISKPQTGYNSGYINAARLAMSRAVRMAMGTTTTTTTAATDTQVRMEAATTRTATTTVTTTATRILTTMKTTTPI
ncbi:uncharacterized protein LOC112557490 [Pomacea canaliculata]|uniref:uncharacterized protein LOC112557490 n=1 Tax=Pomacea canaliculata TaxID=400727 RepID=UPI000D725269|nr:uncharacterized protein LOC112557490 [Pomacea canaliculata]